MRSLVDPEARGRVRRASLLPVSVAASALTEFGRTGTRAKNRLLLLLLLCRHR